MPLTVIDRVVNNRPCSPVEATHHDFSRAADSLLNWWHDAGVGSAVAEAPFDWLGQVKSRAPAAAAIIAGPAFPGTLTDFTDWLMTSDIVDAGPPRRRVSPSGQQNAPLMVLSDCPDRDDIDAKALFAGPLAPLFDKMLAALGHTRNDVYIATLCPGRPVTGRLTGESIATLAPIAYHHIELASPQSLWLVGSAASCAILGIDDARARGSLHEINLNGVSIPTIATAHPRLFEGSKARKAAAWTEMQRLLNRGIA